LPPHPVPGQINALEERRKGKRPPRHGRTVEPTELGQLVFKDADRVVGLSYEMLDIVNYSQHSNSLFEGGVADALSKRQVSKVLMTTEPEDNSIHLR
ncbi:transcriptional activator NhaR, partial [Vibrio parahaemolyticus]|nr:transcriptional activator NhaR [Vibrio parahaemolyticus]